MNKMTKMIKMIKIINQLQPSATKYIKVKIIATKGNKLLPSATKCNNV